MSSPNDNIALKNATDVTFSMRAKDQSSAQDGSLQRVLHLATMYPVDYGTNGCFHTTIKSGSMAAGLAAAAPIVAFRNPSSSILAIIRRVKFSAWSVGTGFTAGLASLDMTVARSFSVQDTGGAAVTLTTPQTKLRASMGAPASVIQASSTATLTAGTRTLDTNPLEALRAAVTTATNTPFIGGGAPAKLYEKAGSDHPLVLVQNEGFILAATVPATGVWSWAAAIEWDEVPLVNY